MALPTRLLTTWKSSSRSASTDGMPCGRSSWTSLRGAISRCSWHTSRTSCAGSVTCGLKLSRTSPSQRART
jgi:hypothetical protein